jgi:hypothetical protein
MRNSRTAAGSFSKLRTSVVILALATGLLVGATLATALHKDRPLCDVPMSVEYCASINWK